MPFINAYIQFDGYSVVDAGHLYGEFIERRYDPKLFFGKANAYISPRGKLPGNGYVLLPWGILKKLDLSATTHTLDFKVGSRTITFEKLVIILATAVTPNKTVTDETVYLVQITDRRWLARMSVVNSCYNYTSPENTEYYARSLNAGNPWTWEQIVDDLWAMLPTSIGAIDKAAANFPTIPPANYDFQGGNAWEALNTVLEDCHHFIVPNAAGTFSIVSATDNTQAVTYQQQLISALPDFQHTEHGKTSSKHWLPETFRVYFPKRNYAFQTGTDLQEPTARNFWYTRAFHTVDVPAAGLTVFPTSVGTFMGLHDSALAVYDEAGNITNAAALTTRATQLATGIASTINHFLNDGRHNIYSGVHVFTVGAEVSTRAYWDVGGGIFTEILLDSDEYAVDNRPGWLGMSAMPGMIEAISHREAPGLADLSRVHPVNEYLCIVDLYEQLLPCASALGYVQYGTNDTPTVASWADTPLPHEIRVYDAFGYAYQEGERVYAHWHQQLGRWIVIPKKGLICVQAIECVQPGDAAECRLMLYDPGSSTMVDTGQTVIVNDYNYQNFLLPDEQTWAYPIVTEDCPATPQYGFIGSYGLLRMAKAVDDIQIDGQGDVVVWWKPIPDGETYELELEGGTDDLAVESTSGSLIYEDAPEPCLTEASLCTLVACNSWPGSRVIEADEKIWVAYQPYGWFIITSPASSVMLRAKLTYSMCPTDLYGTVNSVVALSGSVPDPAPTTAANTLALAGQVDAWVLLVFDSDLDLWLIVQVQHVVQQVETDQRLYDYPCAEGTGSGGGSCAIQIKTRSVAVMSCEVETDWVTNIQFQGVEVLVDVYQQGAIQGSAPEELPSLYGQVIVVCVPCTPTAAEEVLLEQSLVACPYQGECE